MANHMNSGGGRMSLREEAAARAAAAASTPYPSMHKPQQQRHVSSGSSQQQQQQQQTAGCQPTAEEARQKWRSHGDGVTQALENRRRALAHGPSASNQHEQYLNPQQQVQQQAIFSVRVVSAEDRVDPAGSYYTAYLMEVEGTAPPSGGGGPPSSTSSNSSNNRIRHMVEHRYSEFAKLHAELSANKIKMRSSFPTKSLCGRLGNWTPAQHWAPDKLAELVTYRKIKLDIWLVELAELLSRMEDRHGNGQHQFVVHGEVRDMCLEFFQRSAAGCPPCDRANPVSWDGLGGGSSSSSTALALGASSNTAAHDNNHNPSPTTTTPTSPTNTNTTKHAAGTEKLISNPVSFTLGSEIRKATYIVQHMCGPSALSADRSIPLDLLHQARGLCFLTVLKIGCVLSGRVGTGLLLARNAEDGSWSPPSAVGTVGLGYGALVGGDITSYLIILNTDRAVQALAASRGSVNLGAEAGVAVGPVGRSATGNVNAGGASVAPAYAYAHSKGLFVGISLEGSVVACRHDVNAKFYGRPVDPNALLFEHGGWKPRAAQPLYDALGEALEAEIKGFRPSQMGSHRVTPKEGALPPSQVLHQQGKLLKEQGVVGGQGGGQEKVTLSGGPPVTSAFGQDSGGSSRLLMGGAGGGDDAGGNVTSANVR